MSCAYLTISRNPFNPADSRELHEVLAGATLESLAPRTTAPFIMFMNGAPVLRADWSREIAAGDIVGVVMLPRGGGGGSDPLKVILSIAIATVAGPLGESAAWAAFDAGIVADIAGFKAFSALAAAGVCLCGGAHINILEVQQ